MNEVNSRESEAKKIIARRRHKLKKKKLKIFQSILTTIAIIIAYSVYMCVYGADGALFATVIIALLVSGNYSLKKIRELSGIS